jgi:hypothetical protein
MSRSSNPSAKDDRRSNTDAVREAARALGATRVPAQSGLDAEERDLLANLRGRDRYGEIQRFSPSAPPPIVEIDSIDLDRADLLELHHLLSQAGIVAMRRGRPRVGAWLQRLVNTLERE